MQEDIHDDDDQNERFEQSHQDFVDAFGNGKSRIQRNRVVQSRRKILLGLRHQVFRTLCRFDGVRSGELVNGDYGRGFAIHVAGQVIKLSAEFDSRDVSEPDKRAVGICANHDVSKFLL